MADDNQVGAAVLLAIRDMESGLSNKINGVQRGIDRLATDFEVHKVTEENRHRSHERRLDETQSHLNKVSERVEALGSPVGSSDTVEIFGFKVRKAFLVIAAIILAAIIWFRTPLSVETPGGSKIQLNRPVDDGGGDGTPVGTDP